MPVNSRDKGKRGELELAQFLRDRGFAARRGRQYQGGQGSPDLVTNLDGIHVECKRVEAGNLYNWLAQAKAECGWDMPVVMHRRNGEDWVAVLSLEDFLTILKGRKST